MKTIAILKPVYNQAHLADTISRNIRDYGSPEILSYIQDDYSTDNTYEKYFLANLPHTHLTKTPRNFGVRANITSLLESANCDYVNFSAGDDYIYPPTIRALPEILEREQPDILVFKCVHLEAESAYKATCIPDLCKILPAAVYRNQRVFTTSWDSASNFLTTAATNPGLLWSQGLVVSSRLAKTAGFLKSGAVDDWGFQHNLAVISMRTDLKIIFIDSILSIMSIQPNSYGSDAISQLERQVSAVHQHWDPRLKKAALLNCLAKKIEQFRTVGYDYDTVMLALSKAMPPISKP